MVDKLPISVSENIRKAVIAKWIAEIGATLFLTGTVLGALYGFLFFSDNLTEEIMSLMQCASIVSACCLMGIILVITGLISYEACRRPVERAFDIAYENAENKKKLLRQYRHSKTKTVNKVFNLKMHFYPFVPCLFLCIALVCSWLVFSFVNITKEFEKAEKKSLETIAETLPGKSEISWNKRKGYIKYKGVTYTVVFNKDGKIAADNMNDDMIHFAIISYDSSSPNALETINKIQSKQKKYKDLFKDPEIAKVKVNFPSSLEDAYLSGRDATDTYEKTVDGKTFNVTAETSGDFIHVTVYKKGEQ